MSRYPNEAIRRFDQQFAETPQERAEIRTMQLFRQTIGKLQDLVADLSPALDDEGGDFSAEGLEALRRRIANALPPEKCPDWLVSYHDPAVVK